MLISIFGTSLKGRINVLKYSLSGKDITKHPHYSLALNNSNVGRGDKNRKGLVKKFKLK